MTSFQFRSDAELRNKAVALLANPVMQMMLDILRRETPSRKTTKGTVVGQVQSNVLLGAVYGYDDAVDSLMELAVPMPEHPEQPKEDYGAEQYKDQL